MYTMLGASKIKYLRSLHQRKFRQKYYNFVAEGTKTACEVLDSRTLEIEGIYAVKGWLDEQKQRLTGYEDRITLVDEDDLKKISLLKTPNEVFMVLSQPAWELQAEEIQTDISLYLEDIRDPGNMGTILRIADWFGIRWVFCSASCVERTNPKVIQSSMGAFLRVKTREISIDALLEQVELPVFGTLLEGRSVFGMGLPAAAIIVIGNESLGISDEMRARITHAISIPRHEQGGAESLNAGVATGIVCAAFRNLQKG